MRISGPGPAPTPEARRFAVYEIKDFVQASRNSPPRKAPSTSPRLAVARAKNRTRTRTRPLAVGSQARRRAPRKTTRPAPI